MGREELCSLPGRIGAGPQPPVSIPFSFQKHQQELSIWRKRSHPCLLHALLVSKGESFEFAPFLLPGCKDKFVHR